MSQIFKREILGKTKLLPIIWVNIINVVQWNNVIYSPRKEIMDADFTKSFKD